MRDFLSVCLRQALESVGFTSESSSADEKCPLYVDLCSSARSVLTFSAPSGATLSIGKDVSPKLKSAFSIGIPNARSAGFLLTSMDMPPPGLSVFDREVVTPEGDASRIDPVPPAPTPSSQDADPPSLPSHLNYVAYGRIFEDYRLEALVAHTFSEADIVSVSGISSWNSSKPSHLEAQYVHREKDWCADVTFSSTDAVFGSSCCVKVPYTNWSAGAEVIYTHSEKSGGISFGAKWNKSHGNGMNSILTFLANPMMGYLNTTYTACVRKNWVMSTSYDFNTYSYDSDLAFGMAYSPFDNASRLLKFQFSTLRGISILLEGQFKRAIVGLGVSTNLGLDNSAQKQSIGFEVQFL